MLGFNKEVNYDTLKQAASHYRGENGYCSVIAIAIATGCKFGKAKSMMNKCGRESGKGAYLEQINNALTMGNKGAVMYPMAGRRGFTLMTATRNLPKQGTFLVYTRGHVTCIRDGILEDWSAQSRKSVLSVFKVHSLS